MNEQDYLQKLECILNEGVVRGIREQSTNTTEQDLETFQSFSYRILKKKSPHLL